MKSILLKYLSLGGMGLTMSAAVCLAQPQTNTITTPGGAFVFSVNGVSGNPTINLTAGVTNILEIYTTVATHPVIITTVPPPDSSNSSSFPPPAEVFVYKSLVIDSKKILLPSGDHIGRSAPLKVNREGVPRTTGRSHISDRNFSGSTRSTTTVCSSGDSKP